MTKEDDKLSNLQGKVEAVDNNLLDVSLPYDVQKLIIDNNLLFAGKNEDGKLVFIKADGEDENIQDLEARERAKEAIKQAEEAGKLAEKARQEALANELEELLEDEENKQNFVALLSVYNSIFADVYECSEVEPTKYKDWTFRDVVKQFDSPDFFRLPKEDIVALCSEVNQKIAKKLKIKPSVVKFKHKLFNFERTQMDCYVSKNGINIFKQPRKHIAYGYAYLFYILHETYHSYQFQQLERMRNNLPYDNSCVIENANEIMNLANFSYVKKELDKKEKERKKRLKDREQLRNQKLKEKEKARKELSKEQKTNKAQKGNFLENWFENREQKRKKKYEKRRLKYEKMWKEQERQYTKNKAYAVNLGEVSANLFAYNMMDKLFERKYLTNEQAHEYNFAKMNWCLSIQSHFDEIGFNAVKKRTLKNFRTLEKAQQTFKEFLPESTNHNFGIFFDVENQYNVNNYFDKLYSDISKIQMKERLKTKFVEGLTIDEYTRLSNYVSRNEVGIKYIPLEKIRNRYYLYMDKDINVHYGRDLEAEFGGNFDLMEKVDFKKDMKKNDIFGEDESENLEPEHTSDAPSKENASDIQSDNLNRRNLLEKIKDKFFKSKDGKIVESDKNLENNKNLENLEKDKELEKELEL